MAVQDRTRLIGLLILMEMYSSGLRGSPAKGVGRETGAEVQILSSPIRKSSEKIIFSGLFDM